MIILSEDAVTLLEDYEPKHYPEGVTKSAGAASGVQIKFSERLRVPWWGWPLPLIAAVLLAAEMDMGYPGLWAWLPYLIMVPLVAGIILRLGHIRIELTEDELRVDNARLPINLIDEIEVISAKDKRKALGPDLDPTAFVLHRGWVGPVLRIYLTKSAGKETNDLPPYWLFSVRSAARLASMLANLASASGTIAADQLPVALLSETASVMHEETR